MKIELTEPQRQALISAGIAMLAGEEGEGDAQGVRFAVLGRAVGKLLAPTPSPRHETSET